MLKTHQIFCLYSQIAPVLTQNINFDNILMNVIDDSIKYIIQNLQKKLMMCPEMAWGGILVPVIAF